MLDRLSAALTDRYTVDRELGRGGMASVWLARDVRLDRPVALKVLHPELAGAIGVDRFVREIRLTAKLQHPNIVPVLDTGVFPGPDAIPLPWFAMAYVPGESLRARLQRERHLPVEEALRIVEDAAAALQSAHREGIVHRDIKPENLLLAGGRAYVADFGIAKAVIETGTDRLTSTGLVIGTPTYMSPEQASAQPVDARTDQYSLASVLYEMLVGEPPFTGPTAQAIVARRLAEPARAIHPVRPSVPAGVEAAVLRALERVPADRFPDVAAFANALRSMPPTGTPKRERRARWVLGAVAVVFAAAAFAAWAMGHRRSVAPVARDPEVVALYQRGVREYDKRTPRSIGEAVQAFTAAVRRDSTYTESWAGLAKTYVRAYERRFVFPGVARDSVLQLAVAAADRALTGDRRSSNAWATQAIVSRIVDPDRPRIAHPIAAGHALVLDSTNADAWHFLALSLAESRDLDGAIAGLAPLRFVGPVLRPGISIPRPRPLLASPVRQRGSVGGQLYCCSSRATCWARPRAAASPSSRGLCPSPSGLRGGARLSTDVEVIECAGRERAGRRPGRAPHGRRAAFSSGPIRAGRPLRAGSASYRGVSRRAYAGLGDASHAVAWLRRITPRNDLHFQLHLRCDPSVAPIERDLRFRSLLLAPRPEASTDGCLALPLRACERLR